MFRTVPLSIIRSFSLYTQQWYMSYRFADSLRAGLGRSVLILLASCQQTCMTYTVAVCIVKNSWWWTEELSETCRVLFQKQIWEIGASSWFYYKNLSRCTVTWTSNSELKYAAIFFPVAQPYFVLNSVLVRNALKPSVQGFGGETWGKEATWKSQA